MSPAQPLPDGRCEWYDCFHCHEIGRIHAEDSFDQRDAPIVAIVIKRRPVMDSFIDSIDIILRESLADPDVTLMSGCWRDGAVMELVPHGRARLSVSRYDGAFAGVRDLSLGGVPHHMHLDLARLRFATYVFAPSVCFGFQPSFELRLGNTRREALARYGVALSIGRPYRGGQLRIEVLQRYFQRLIDHRTRFPQIVKFRAGGGVNGAQIASSFDWSGLSALLMRLTGRALTAPSTEALSRLITAL